jgi:hypothetical protein
MLLQLSRAGVSAWIGTLCEAGQSRGVQGSLQSHASTPARCHAVQHAARAGDERLGWLHSVVLSSAGLFFKF